MTPQKQIGQMIAWEVNASRNAKNSHENTLPHRPLQGNQGKITHQLHRKPSSIAANNRRHT